MTTVTIPSRLYAKLQAMAERADVPVTVIIEDWLETLVDLDKRKRTLALRYARLLKENPGKWAEIIETILDRADLPE